MHTLARAAWLLLWALLLPPAAAQDEYRFSQAELDQMLAPIALYPDSLLAQILMAATYPLEVVEAARWSRAHPGLDGERAVAAAEAEPWDPSVKALVAFPHVLDRMDRDLDWTRDLGEAFLYQEADVMATIQHLRERAYAAGHLDSLEYARVYHEPDVILIEPVHSHVVFVPYYDPWVVYGDWWWPAYPPVYWGPPRHYHMHTGPFYWGSGVHISTRFFFSSFNWHDHHVIVLDYHQHEPWPYYRPGKHYAKREAYRRWYHQPQHRRSVPYHHPGLQREYARQFDHQHGPDKRHHLGRRDHDAGDHGVARQPRGEHRFRRADDRRELEALTPHARRSVLETRARIDALRDRHDGGSAGEFRGRTREDFQFRDRASRRAEEHRLRQVPVRERGGRETVDSSHERVRANRAMLQRERIDSSRSRVEANRTLLHRERIDSSRGRVEANRRMDSGMTMAREYRGDAPQAVRSSVGGSERQAAGNRHASGNRRGEAREHNSGQGRGPMH